MNEENDIKRLKVASMEAFLNLLKDQRTLWGDVEASESEKKILEYKEDIHGWSFRDVDANSIGVHSGPFHADEVVCVALAELGMDKEIKIIRSRDPEELKKADICVDVNEGVLDHHGPRALDRVSACMRFVLAAFNTDLQPGWDNDIDFSCEEGAQASLRIWNEIIVPVSEWDTGHPDEPHPFPEVRRLCEHAVATDRDMDEAFSEAVNIVKRQLKLLLQTWGAEFKATKTAEEELRKQPDTEVIVFHELSSKKAPVKELIYKMAPKAVYYVSPETADDWRVLCACNPEQEFSSFGSRKLIPEKYRGLRGDALSEATGIPGGIFSHAAGFIAGFKTADAAEAFARKILTE